MSTHPYNYPASQADDFERKGHPGRFLKSITCTTGTTYFTGSYFGAGGIIVPSGVTGTASLSAGGDILLGNLSSNNPPIYEFSLRSVKVDSGTVYVLIKNPSIW
jgi:hypothetical protein